MAISFIVFTLRTPSRFYVIGHNAGFDKALLYTTISLIFGWWGVPWGPIYTISSVFSNVVGGRKFTVGDLVAEMTGHERNVVTLTERAAVQFRHAIDEKGFPHDTALRVAIADPFGPEYHIEYDLPTSDGRQWVGESHGVTVVVDKSSASELEGLIVDYDNGEFTVRKNEEFSTTE